MNPQVFSVAVVGVLLNACAQLAIKWGTTKIASISLREGLWTLFLTVIGNSGVIVGLGCYVISVGLWVYVLSKVEVSIAYPMLSIGYIFNLILAHWFFGEQITFSKVMGIGLIILGVVVLTKGNVV